MDKDIILWFVLFLVFLIVEVLTVSLTCIWFAAGALLALILALFNVPILVQFIVFAILSIVLMIFTKPVLSRKLLANREKTNYESVIGQSAKVTEQINNIDNKGTVMLNGLEWTARSVDDRVIEVDTIVEVVRVEGVKVIVKK